MTRTDWLMGVLLVAVGLTNCGDDDSRRPTGPEDGPKVSYTEEYVPLEFSTMENLTELRDDGTLAFSEGSEVLRSLAPGKIIAHGPTAAAPYGFLKKVWEVRIEGGRVVVSTTDATLEEVYEEAVIEVQRELSLGDLEGTPRMKSQVILHRERSSQDGFYLEIDDAVLYDKDGNWETTSDQIRANGSMTIQPSYEFYLEIRSSTLRKLRFVTTTVQTIRLEIGADTGLSGEGTYRLAEFSFTPITMGVLTFRPVLAVDVGAQVNASLAFKTFLAQTSNVEAGLEYNEGSWTPIRDFSRSFDFDRPALAADVEATGFVRSQLNLLFYGVAGPYAQWNGYLELESNVRTVDVPWWQLYGGAEMGVGVDMRFLGRSIADYYAPAVVGYRDFIAQAEDPFINLPPIASAGLDQEVFIGDIVVLDGSESEDPEAMALRYAWRQVEGPTASLSDPSTSQPSFTPEHAGTYLFELVVEDGVDPSEPDAVMVVVRGKGGSSAGGTVGETISVDLSGGTSMEFVWIAPGTFLMGSPDSEPWRDSDEGPQHQVRISQGFWLGKYELTQGQWEAVMGTTPWLDQRFVRSDPNHPAVYISWDDVQGLIEKLNLAAEEEIYRLPTEAEWEYACRAGTATRWSFGEDESRFRDYAWFRDNAWDADLPYAQPVGRKLPNPWGLCDMYGNVFEWCRDRYGNYLGNAQVDPTGPASGSARVLRGSDFISDSRYARSAARYGVTPDGRIYDIGARLLRTK